MKNEQAKTLERLAVAYLPGSVKDAIVAGAEALLDSGERAQAEAAELRARTTPEVIGEKHRDGNYWQVWCSSSDRWVEARYLNHGEWWKRRGHETGLFLAPTHALPMPPKPEGTDA